MIEQADRVNPAAMARVKDDCRYSEGRISSGDVSLFYRRFGTPGKTPILAMHGMNYFDSFDWIEVASRIASDREVIVFDHRGFGESSWSPSKNYSVDTKLADILTLLDAFDWGRPIILGHSGSGRLAISFAAAHPERVERCIVVDTNFERDALENTGHGNPPILFDSVEAAMARYARLVNPPRMALDRARAEQALMRTADGWQLKLDPDYGNVVPIGDAGDARPLRELNVWEQLAKVQCPMLLVRGLRSSRWKPGVAERIAREFPWIRWATADSIHDIAYYAPDELVAAVRGFVGDI